jgi:signal transduction histidine kinase
MIERLTSLRVWLLAAMLATAVVTLVAGNFIVNRLSASSARAADQAKGLIVARAVASQVHGGAGVPQLRALQQMLPNDQILVIRHGSTVFAGPPRASRPLELTVHAPFPGGQVILRDHQGPAQGGLAQETLVAGVIAALIIGEAWLAATVLVRTVRKPVGRAIGTADRLAAGDLSARMGASGPEEFAHLGRAFDGMAAQLQQADTEQKRFLADLAHEIATPVTAVSGFALALADGSAGTAAERAEAAGIISHESNRLQRLLDDVRNLNRLELAGTARPAKVDIDALCEETARRFRFAAQNATVSLVVHPGHVSVIADPRQIETVVDNFVSNAIRYTPARGRVEIRPRRRRSAAVIAVRDTGIGIARQHLERIFDRLYRVDEARDRATGGSGLGLALARRAAQSLGARIEVQSKPGEGSEFRLILPAVPRSSNNEGSGPLPPAPEPGPAPASPPAGRRA